MMAPRWSSESSPSSSSWRHFSGQTIRSGGPSEVDAAWWRRWRSSFPPSCPSPPAKRSQEFIHLGLPTVTAALFRTTASLNTPSPKIRFHGEIFPGRPRQRGLWPGRSCLGCEGGSPPPDGNGCWVGSRIRHGSLPDGQRSPLPQPHPRHCRLVSGCLLVPGNHAWHDPWKPTPS